MLKSNKTIFGITGIIVLGVIAAFGFAAITSRQSLAQAPTPTQQAPGTQTGGGDVLSQYNSFFLQEFATQLGVTVDKLKQSFITAVTNTLAQAVKDGKLTQTQANQVDSNLQTWANNGMQGFPFGKMGGRHGGFGFGFGHLEKGQLIADFAKALNIDQQTLETDLQNGQSIADIATAQKVDINQVKQSVLAAEKSRLDTAVQNSQLTQAQADQIYQNLSSSIDNIVNQKWNAGGRRGEWGEGHGWFGPLGPNNPSGSPTAPSTPNTQGSNY